MRRSPSTRFPFVTFIVVILGIAACARTIEDTPSTFEKHLGTGRPIVFLPGVKGSALADPDGHIVYLTRAEVLGASTPNLALPARMLDGRQDRDGLSAHGILRELYLIPGILGEQIYGPWLDALASSGRPVYLFAYDWRRDNLETLRELERLVHMVRSVHDDRVDIIGHSMGGMLAYALVTAEADDSSLNDFSPDDVASLTLAGSPLRGGVGFLPDLHDGSSIGMNDELLAPEVLATYPSIYSFFPRSSGSDITPTLDFFDAASWREAKLGPYAEGRTLSKTFDVFFVTALERASAFRARVDAAPVRSLPITVVASRATPTVATALAKDGTYSFATGLAAGDGRVPFDRALPQGPYRVVETKNEHAQLLNDPHVISAILAN